MLTPNENAARTLGVAPLSIETLARQVLGEERTAHPLLAQNLLRAAVEEVLGSGDPEGVSRTLIPSIRELFRSGVDTGMDPGSPRARRVFAVAQNYEARLRARGLVDSAQVLWEAARCAPPQRPASVWGYPRVGPAEVAFVDAVAGEGSAVCFPFAEGGLFADNLQTASDFEGRGWAVERDPIGAVWEVGEPTEAHSYPHLEAEVRGALARVKMLLADGASFDDVVLVARDDAAYGPTVLSVAREYGVPVRALYRIPLSETRVGHWLGLVFEAMVEGFPFESTARFLAHTLGPGIPAPRWATARMIHPRGSAAWEELGIDLSPLAWPEMDTRVGWLKRCNTLVGAYALNKKALSWPREMVALARAKDELEWLAEPAEEPISRERFIGEVDEVLRATDIPAHPARKGVALHTPLSLYGARYRFVLAMGLTEGGFPPPVSDDPALDFHERKRLRQRGVRLELADERARRERLSFWALTRVPRERLVLSYPRLADGRETLPSPYFGLVGIRPTAPGLPPAASPEEARRAYLQQGSLEGDPVLGRAKAHWEVERRREGPEPFDRFDGVLGVPVDYRGRRFSVSELGDLVHCGFRWWSRSVLGLSEPEEGEPPALVGRLYHKALEIAVRRAEGTADLRGGVLENLEGAFKEAEDELEMASRARAWTAWSSVYLDRLRRAVQSEDFALPGAEALETEVPFTGEWRGFEVVGRVDRIDRTPEGLVFVDYKSTSSAPKPDLQLAVYREAAAPALFPEEPVRDAYYYSLRQAERIKSKEPDDETLAGMAEEVRTSLEAGRMTPDVLQRACAFCEFDLVCRRGPRLDRKGAKDP